MEQIDWTQVIIALIIGAGGVGLWQAWIVKIRLDSKERMALQEDKDAISQKWREIYQQLQQERDALNTQRISDRHAFQEQLAALEMELKKTQAELGLAISAYKEIRNDLHVAERRLAELEQRDREKTEKIERLKQQIYRLGGEPDTGPLDQGTK